MVSIETKKKMSESAKARCTAARRKEMSERLATKLPISKVRSLYSDGHTQYEIAAILHTTQKVVWRFMKANGITARTACKRNQWGERNHSWKGELASYKAMHQRLTVRFGKLKRCEQCGTTDKRRSYDWANLTGDYGDVTDYRRLCRSCHWKLDNKILNIATMRERMAARG